MTILAFVITLLVSYTLVFALQEGKLPGFIDSRIEKLRGKYAFFENLFGCSFCLGFWTGLLSYALVHLATQGLTYTWSTFALWPLVGLASSATCYLLSQVSLLMDYISMRGMEEELPPELENILEQRRLMQDPEFLQDLGFVHDQENRIFVDTVEDKDYFCSDCGGCQEVDDEDEEEDQEDGPDYRH